MISPHLLDILRCPMDPQRQSRLAVEGDRLVCSACGLRYRVKDGFPVMIVEDAELPAGCESLDQLAPMHLSAQPAAV